MRRPWLHALLWAVFIETLVLWPSPPDVPQPFTIVGFDKMVHAAVFAVQAALVGRALRIDGRPWWPAMVGSIAFGAVTEWQQQFIPSRSMELDDLLADAIGAVVGLSVFAAWALRRRELHR
ncbi:MAG: VanZ family protein [Gemmatimonadota bacterium]|nr:VanZ family protein [Gemmatimonadota bacterium]